MNTNIGTDTRQFNCSPNSQSGFAAINPPVNPLRAGIMPPDGTALNAEQWSQVMQPAQPTKLAYQPNVDTAFSPVVSQPAVSIDRAVGAPATNIVNSNPIGGPAKAAESMERLRHPKKTILDQPIFGVVTIDNLDWSPRRLDDLPPSLTQGLGMELSAHYAMIYNQSCMAVNKQRWALVSTRGSTLILCGVALQDRPSNPGAFTAIVQGGLTYNEAERMALEANQPRWQLSKIPRQWTIAVRRADTVGKDGEV